MSLLAIKKYLLTKYFVITYKGRGSKKEYIYMHVCAYIYELLCHTLETNMTL